MNKTSTYNVAILVLLAILFGCSEKKNDYQKVKNISKKNINVRQISLDTITLESFNTSYIGDASIFGNNIYFLDAKFSFVYKFDVSGKLIKRYVGQGEGKNELPIKSMLLHTFMPNGNSIFIGSSYDCYVFDREFNKIKEFNINWHSSKTAKQLVANPDLDDNGMFSLLYNGVIDATNETLYFPIASQHPKLNPTLSNYAKDIKVIGRMDIDNGYVDKIYGKLSPVYSQNLGTLTFAYAYVNVYEEGKTLLSFPVDPLMYIVDDEFDIMRSFGFQGREMNLQYKGETDPRKFRNNHKEQLKEAGYYTFVKYIKGKDIIFRGYHKSGSATTDGLQVYKNETLIADVDVPVGFKVEGYIAPYFYSNAVIDESKEAVKILRFKL